MLRLHTLGAVSVAGTQKPLSGAATQRRRLALLALLAVAGERGLSRDTILGLLWAETGGERGRHALAQSLYALKRDLGADALFLGTTELKLNAALITSDIAELEAMLAQGELARAIALYTGPFLDGLYVGDAPDFERWVDGERARIHAIVARAVRTHAAALSASNDHANAATAWKRLAALSPLDGAAILDVMRGLAAAGDRAGALVQARIHETLLREELEAAPDPAISALAAELKVAPAATVTPTSPRVEQPARVSSPALEVPVAIDPVLTPHAARLHNLPADVNSFVGRRHERADVAALLESSRLVTITGAGGSGKTRLSLQVARDRGDSFSDGVCWIELADITDGSAVAQSIASVLGLGQQASVDGIAAIADYLRHRGLLIVLDNCEHVLDACATLVTAILRAAPGVRILATSREPLGIDGESIWSLPLLALPAETKGLSPVDISVSESVQLFVERALAVKPSFRVTEQNAHSIIEIVRRLDGMPLALELAAARVKHMTVEQIAERLSNRFNLLSTGSRAALPRQQTLRALLDWGHDLLSEPERAAFARLAVFSGGWTLASAEAVCAGELVPAEDVLDLLSQLVDKSIVTARERHGATRYSLLETMHQYALEKLHDAGDDELAAAHDAHATYFARYAEETAPALATAARATWLPRLDDEAGNFRAALRRSQVSRDGGAVALRIAIALGWFWYHRGAWREGRGWLEGALLLPAAIEKSSARASALRTAGIAAWLQGNHRVATYRLEESIEISRALKEERAVAGTLSILAQVVLNAGDASRARGIGEESVQRWRTLGRDSAGLALGLASLGNVAVASGSYERAVELANESASIFRKLRDDWAVSLPVRCLGMAALRTGDLETAERNFREALELCVDSRECWFLSRSVDGLASVAALAGDAERAAKLLGAAERLREAVGTPVLPLHQSDRGRSTAVVRTLLSEQEFSAASSAGRELSIDEALSYARLAAVNPTPVVVSEPRRMTPASSS